MSKNLTGTCAIGDGGGLRMKGKRPGASSPARSAECCEAVKMALEGRYPVESERIAAIIDSTAVQHNYMLQLKAGVRTWTRFSAIPREARKLRTTIALAGLGWLKFNSLS